MSALKLNLADPLRLRVEARAAENGYSNLESYIEALLVADAAGDAVLGDDELEALLIGRLDGPFVTTDTADFQQMRKKLENRIDGGNQ